MSNSCAIVAGALLTMLFAGCGGGKEQQLEPPETATELEAGDSGAPETASPDRAAENGEEASPELLTIPLPEEPLAPAWLPGGLPVAAEGLAFDGLGGLFLGGNDGSVYRLEGGGPATLHVQLLPVAEGVLPGTAGLAVGPDGTLYACRYSASRIEAVPPSQPPAAELFLDGIVAPNSLLFDSRGRLWLTSSGDKEHAGFVARLAPDKSLEVVVAGIVYANGLALSPDERTLYFTSTDPGSLHAAALDDEGMAGEVLLLADAPELSVADGLAVAADGTLFVAGFGTGRIFAWRNGALTTVAHDPTPPGLMGVASLALGAGPGFSPTALYATNLLQPRLAIIELTPAAL